MATKKPQPAYLSAPVQDLNWDAAEAYLNQPTATQPESSSSGVFSTTGDMAIKAAQGVIGIGESAVGLGSLVTGGLAGEGMRAIGYDPKAAKAMLGEHLSDAQKGADAEVAKADGFVDTVLTALRNPRSIAGSVAESLPSTLMGMGITLSAARAIGAKAALAAAAEHGGLATAAGQKAGAEATKAALEQATGKLMWIGSGVEGAQSGGQIADQAQSEGSDWSQYAAPSALAGIGTAAIGRGAGKLMGDTETAIIARAAGGSTAAGIAGKMPARIAKSMFSEGALEEAPQSAWEQAQTNIAANKPWQDGMGNAAGMGMVTGAAMGGGTAIAQGRTPADTIRETETVPESGPLTRAANAATEQKALQLENNPDPLMAFPDGTVGKRAEVDAYINGLPENERMAARAKLYGYGPERVSQPEPIPQAPLALPGPDSAIPGGAMLAGENGVSPETYGDRQATDAALRQREELGTATPRGEAPIEIQPPQTIPDAAQPAIQVPQPKSTGSFGAMDEFGQLMQAEKTDLSAQRAQATQAQFDYLAQQAARLDTEIATVDASVEQRDKTRAANARMSIIDSVLADPGIDGIANKKGEIAADLKRAGYSGTRLSDVEVAHIDRHADLAQTLNTPDILPSTPNEIPADIVPEKKVSAPLAPVSKSGGIALPIELQVAADISNDPTQFSKALNAAKIKISERKPFMDAFKAQLKERGTSNDSIAADAADARPGNADAVLGVGDLRGNRVAATGKTQAASSDKIAVQDNPDANGQSSDGAITHLNPSGKPFITEFSAKKKLRDLNLASTHAVTKVADGFVMQPIASATEHSAITAAPKPVALTNSAASTRPVAVDAPAIGKEVIRYTSRQTGADGKYKNGSGMDAFNARQFSGAQNREHPELQHFPVERDNGRFDVVGYVKTSEAKEKAPITASATPTKAKRASSGAQVARANLKRDDPFRAFLAENGVHPDDRADIGVDRKITAMTPGYGPIFKKSAPRMDMLAQRALKAGHLTQHDIDSDTDNGGTGKLSDMIRRAVGNREVIRPDEVGAEELHGADAQLMEEAATLGINTDGKTLDQVYDAVAEHHKNQIEELDADIPFFENDPRMNKEILSDADLDKIFGKQPESAGVSEEAHTENAGASRPEVGEKPGFALQGETATETSARLAEEDRRRYDAKAGADNLQSGKATEELLSRQVFSQPEAAKETDKEATLFDRAGFMSDGTTVESLNAEVERLTGTWKNAPKISMVQSVDELPFAAPYDARGAYYRGQVWLVADNLQNAAEAQFVLFHETLGHAGLRGMFSDGMSKEMNALSMKNRGIREEAAKWRAGNEDIRGNRTDAQWHAISIEESLADMAGSGKSINGIGKFLAALQNGLRAIGLDKVANWLESATDAEAMSVLAGARKYIEKGDKPHAYAGKEAKAFDRKNDAAFSRVHIPTWAETMAPEVQDALRKSGAIYDEKTWKDKVNEIKSGALKKMQYGILDQFAPIKDQLGRIPYIMARMAKSVDGTLEAIMLYGQPKLDSEGGMLVDASKKGFVETMQALNGEHERFFSWLAGKRAAQLKAEGRENLFTDDNISSLSGLNLGNMADGSSRAIAYAKAQKEVSEMNKSVLDIAEQSGLIDSESRKVWASDFYVPFYRIMEEGITGPSIKSGLVNQKSIKKLKGGTNNLGDLTQNMLMNWSTLLTASAKNRAARASLTVAANIGAATEADETTIRQMGKSVSTKAVSYMDAGENRWFVVEDEHLLAAISALEFNGYNNGAMKVMSAFKNVLTRAVTMMPLFKVRNLMRDSISSIAVADAGWNPVTNFKQGRSLLKDKQFKADMIAGGGVFRFGTLMEGNRGAHVKSLIDSGVRDSSILDTKEKMQAFAQKIWDAYQEVGDLSENVNRAALYDKLRGQGMSHLEASFEARDLMDFGLSGAWAGVRALNQVLPFFNARLQGIYKLGRGYNDDPKRMGYVIGAVALASIVLLLAYKDDEDFKKRSDSDRNSYWWFKVGATAIRIPKPFEIGAAGSAIEHFTALFLDSENTDSKRFAHQMGELINGQLAMNPIPQMMRPMIDIYANKDAFTGRPIESMSMQRLKPEDRYTYNTSELARMMSKSGVFIDPVSLVSGTGVKQLSPVQIDSMIRGYFSGIGTMATAAVDGLLRSTVIDRGESLPMTLKDFAGSFAESLPSNSSRYVDMLYQSAQGIDQAYASYRNAVKSGDAEKAQAILASEGPEIAKYHMVERLKKSEGRMTQQVQKIRNSKTMSGEEKAAQIQTLRQAQDRVARALH